MSAIPDDKLFSFGNRVKGKVVLITGAANGIGKETALRFAEHGAKVVIGDLDIESAKKVVAQVEKAGGNASCLRCNVTDFEQQVDLFELAIKNYGSVDVVIPNAGVSELGSFQKVEIKDGRPVKPNLKTLDINLYGVLYTAHLAMHYLSIGKKEGDLKALVFVGSMASWQAIPMGEMYSGSKHAVLGVMRALHPIMALKGIRVACIHPFFADTGIVPIPIKLALAGIPLTPVSRIAGALFFASTDPDMETSGSVYLLPDDGEVFMVPKEEFKLGVYGMIDDRANGAKALANRVVSWRAIARDVWKHLGVPIAIAGATSIAFLGAAAILMWDRQRVVSGEGSSAFGLGW